MRRKYYHMLVVQRLERLRNDRHAVQYGVFLAIPDDQGVLAGFQMLRLGLNPVPFAEIVVVSQASSARASSHA